MKCYLTRCYVSRSLDSPKSIPTVFRRHLHKCPSCQKFQSSCYIIHENAEKEADSVIQKTSPLLYKKMKSTVTYSGSLQRKAWQKKILIPVVSTSAVLLCVAWLIFLNPFGRSSSGRERPDIPLLRTFYATEENLQNLTSQIGIHYEKEWSSLKRAARDASRYFIEKLDLRINSSQKEESS